jgi:hypothetical protein
MKKLLFIGFLLSVLLFVAACTSGNSDVVVTADGDQGQDSDSIGGLGGADADTSEDSDDDMELTACTTNSDCDGSNQCIDNVCGVLADHYDTTCDSLCTLDEVRLTTSDDEEKTLGPGLGSYTSAGALEWKVMSPPGYCEGDNVVPFEITTFQNGVIVGQEVTLVDAGKTSRELKHPNIDRIVFTLAVDSVSVTCS